MTNITDFGPSRPIRTLDQKIKSFDRTVVPEFDYLMLQEHLNHCETARGSSWLLLSYVLQQKIMCLVPGTGLPPPGLVTGLSRVTYIVNGSEKQAGTLTHRARSGLGNDAIPVASLLGATLIGMRVGQRAALLCVDRSVRTILVLDVTQVT